MIEIFYQHGERQVHIRSLEYLIALELEKHFARAAARCNVSQPTLSTALTTLEQQLGKRLVERGRTFVGLTRDGEAVLPWARQMIAAYRNLTAAAGSDSAHVGELRLGCIPAAMPVTGSLTDALLRAHPALKISYRAMNSAAILRGIGSFELDAGISYLDHEPLPHTVSVPLYSEQFLFLAAEERLEGVTNIPLAEALAHRLCLLPPDMQNRRILDEQLARLGHPVDAVVTAESYEALIAMVVAGHCATFLPDSYQMLLPRTVRAVPIAPAMPRTQVGILVADHQTLTAAGMAAFAAGRQLVLPPSFQRVDRR